MSDKNSFIANVVRNNGSTVTITLPAFGSYDISAQETIEATVPAAALGSTTIALVATPTFNILKVPVASQVVITGAGSDFSTDGSTNLTVQVQDPVGDLVTTDSTTQITFSPTLSGTISAVVTGSGDSSYGVVGGAETVTVAGGIATVTLVDTVMETFVISRILSARQILIPYPI